MYSLEDDQETSSRLIKHDHAGAEAQPGTFGAPIQDEETEDANAQQATIQPPAENQQSTAGHRFAPQQVTASLKKLATPGGSNGRNQKVALAALTVACIGVFVTALDQTVVVTALPQIITSLQVPITQLDHAAWIISAYLLGFVVAMPLMGRVSDIYGRRRIFLLCLIIFGIGSVLCGLAPELGQVADLSFLGVLHIDTTSPGLIWLIAARLFQAVGGGAIVPVAMAIAGDFYGQERRGLALGVIGAVTEAGGVLGPLYGALIVQRFGWQFIFYFNAPIVIALMVAAWMLIPRGTRLREGIDWPGALLLGLALTCLSLGLAQQGTDLGPTMPNSPAPQNNPIALALAALCLIAFILVERKVRWPVVDLGLFKRFPFSATSLVSLFVGAALIIAMADIPIFVDTVLQLPVLASGLALLRLTAMIPLGALLGGWLCSRISCRVTGVIGLLFTAVGFFLMSRWPIHVDWTQITISTVTAGFGFGLVIAPIGTTAINAVRAKQAGMGSAIVTALRMVGMMLGLAALTSWALAYFKELAAQYPSLPVTATTAQFAQWSQGYAAHLVQAAHTVYSAVFFVSMILCLVAIIPAIFLWGNHPPVDEAEPVEDVLIAGAAAGALVVAGPDVVAPSFHAAVTLPGTDEANPLAPPGLPDDDDDGNGGNGGNGGNRWHDPRRRRRLIAIASIVLVLLLIGGGVFAAFMWQSDESIGTNPAGSTANPTGAATATPIAGSRMIQLALDKGALTSIFASQLNLQQGALSNLSVTPTPNNGLILSLDLHIDASGIHRVLPVELDCVISVDKQQNLQFQVLHLKRDGRDAGPATAAQMQSAMNQLLTSTVMPALHHQLKGIKLISARTSTDIVCGKGTEMLVLLIQAPPIQGIAAQPTPTSFCLTGPINPSKLLPS
jgi:MFS family permease